MQQKAILCYGDSNTWGYVPTENHSAIKTRYIRSERWTGVLQNLLGCDYYIIEEGLNSRTTNINYAIPPDRNGKNYLAPCLYSHAPLDLVILALGGNDMKTYFNRTPVQISEGLGELINIIQDSSYGVALQHPPQILMITSAIPLPFVEDIVDENGIKFLAGIVKKAKEVIPLLEQLAQKKSCHFMDVSTDIFSSKIDGIHYDKKTHQKLAELLSVKIKNIFI